MARNHFKLFFAQWCCDPPYEIYPFTLLCLEGREFVEGLSCGWPLFGAFFAVRRVGGLAAAGALASAEGEQSGESEEGDQGFHQLNSYKILGEKWNGFPAPFPFF